MITLSGDLSRNNSRSFRGALVVGAVPGHVVTCRAMYTRVFFSVRWEMIG